MGFNSGFKGLKVISEKDNENCVKTNILQMGAQQTPETLCIHMK